MCLLCADIAVCVFLCIKKLFCWICIVEKSVMWKKRNLQKSYQFECFPWFKRQIMNTFAFFGESTIDSQYVLKRDQNLWSWSKVCSVNTVSCGVCVESMNRIHIRNDSYRVECAKVRFTGDHFIINWNDSTKMSDHNQYLLSFIHNYDEIEAAQSFTRCIYGDDIDC